MKTRGIIIAAAFCALAGAAHAQTFPEWDIAPSCHDGPMKAEHPSLSEQKCLSEEYASRSLSSGEWLNQHSDAVRRECVSVAAGTYSMLYNCLRAHRRDDDLRTAAGTKKGACE